jgi:hypothetical protein
MTGLAVRPLGPGDVKAAGALLTASHDRVTCYLHTLDHPNVEYYRRHGFELTHPCFPAGPRRADVGLTRPRRIGVR